MIAPERRTGDDVDVVIGPMDLDSGEHLAEVVQRVTIYTHSASPPKTALVCHALTGSSRVAEWWPGMFADGGLFADDGWRVIGINVLGGCYGSSPVRGGRVSVADIVRAQRRALTSLSIGRLDLVIGGSLGGMQALQWAVDEPGVVRRAAIVGAHDHHSAMGVALNALQREALAIDPQRGLRLARKIAMLTYKSEDLLNERHGRRRDRHGVDRFDVEGYLEHQADIFEQRMDVHAYGTLTHAMDAFDLREAAISPDVALLFIGISSDWLFRATDVRAAAERLAARGARADYAELRSHHGHDAFLAEPVALSRIIARTAST